MSRPGLSFEFFPPRDPAGRERLDAAARALAAFGPRFVSVTYGAGGSTRTATLDAARRLGRLPGLRVAGHLTCVGATRAETLSVARAYAAAGLRDIVALRGDPPRGQGGFVPHPDGFRDSVELIAALKAMGDFRIHVGAYPDRHPDAADADADIVWLKRKFEAGADSALTQFFFDPETFFRFRDRAAAAGIDADRIAPGILPVQNWTKVQQFAAGCGAAMPPQIAQGFENAARQGNERLYALAQATQLADRLVEGGVRHLHFYTLNSAGLTRDVCRALGMRARPFLADAALSEARAH
jgi:methylenetetrahydrofolate reductase (NADPH)